MSAAGMPATDKTPAPSRRFLPPSSSSSGKPWTSSSSRKTPFSCSQGNFTLSSTSPFTRSSRFGTPTKPQDEDIETSFGDSNSSPLSVTRRRFEHSAASDEEDAIDDEDVRDANHPERQPRWKLQEESSHIEDELQSPRTNWTRAEFPGSRDNADPATPLRKRRKVLIPRSHKRRDIIAISSSPELDEQLGQHNGEEYGPRDEDRHAEHGYNRVAPSPGLITPPMPTRFRTPMTKTEITRHAPSKPSFRPFAKDKHLAAESALALPDAFSPSRRKGKKDYLSGGLADTVRNWVLNAATEESHHHPRLEQMIDVEEAIMETGGRAIVAIGPERERWLLVGAQDKGSANTLASMLETIRERGKVIVRGSSTNWVLPFIDAEGKRLVHVATQWDAG